VRSQSSLYLLEKGLFLLLVVFLWKILKPAVRIEHVSSNVENGADKQTCPLYVSNQTTALFLTNQPTNQTKPQPKLRMSSCYSRWFSNLHKWAFAPPTSSVLVAGPDTDTGTGPSSDSNNHDSSPSSSLMATTEHLVSCPRPFLFLFTPLTLPLSLSLQSAS
jgi:hypothetical protein